MGELEKQVAEHETRIRLLEQSDQAQTESLKEIKIDVKEVVKLTQEIKSTTCSQIPALEREIKEHKRTHSAVNHAVERVDRKWLTKTAMAVTLIVALMSGGFSLLADLIRKWLNW